MTTRKLKKPEWEKYFNKITKNLAGKRITIDVISITLGDQRETTNIQLLGMSYDPKGDNVEVMMDGLNHRIAHAVAIEVEDTPNGLESIHIEDSRGEHQILKLSDSLRLMA